MKNVKQTFPRQSQASFLILPRKDRARFPPPSPSLIVDELNPPRRAEIPRTQHQSFSISSCSSVLPTLCNGCSAAESVLLSRSKGAIVLTLLARSLTCLSPLSGLNVSNAASNCNRYSRFSPLGPRLSLIFFAISAGFSAPRNCGLSGIPI